jgi:hypothetical protein
VGVALSAVAVILQAAAAAIDFGAFDLRVWALNGDRHYSVPGLASLLAQAAVAAASAWRWAHDPQGRRGWATLALLVGALVIVRGLVTFDAALLAAPLAGVLAAVIWGTWRDPRWPRALTWVGLAALAASLALHRFGLAADDSTASDYTWAYQLTDMVKHAAELAGWLLVATGVAAGGLRAQAQRQLPGSLEEGGRA